MEFNAEAIDAAATGFSLLFLASMASAKPIYVDLCAVLESKGAQETFVIPEGVGEMREWTGELEAKPSIIWSQTIVNKDWESTLEVPRNAYMDDQLGVYKQQAQMMGVSAATHPDSLLYTTLVEGFANKGYDKVAFFSDSHPIKDGVQSNLQTGALSATTFRAAMAKLRSMTDYYGRPLRARSMGMKYVLMVGPSNEATAKSIVSVPTTASGAGNPDYQAADVMVNEYLTGAKAGYWFLVCSGGPVYPFILQMREKPDFQVMANPTDVEVRLRKRVLHTAQGRWNMGYGFYQLAVGSQGA